MKTSIQKIGRKSARLAAKALERENFWGGEDSYSCYMSLLVGLIARATMSFIESPDMLRLLGSLAITCIGFFVVGVGDLIIGSVVMVVLTPIIMIIYGYHLLECRLMKWLRQQADNNASTCEAAEKP